MLWDLHVPQEAATVLFEDNDGCTAMGNAQKPTSRTRHIDIKYFSLCEWVERDLMLLERINTSINTLDHMTKNLQTILFHCHANFILGHVPPMYSPVYESIVGTYTNHMVDIDHYVPPTFTTPTTAAATQVQLPSCPTTKTTHGLLPSDMDSTIHFSPFHHIISVHDTYQIVDCGGVTLDRLVDT